MSVNVRHPIWLPAAPAPGISVFATLYFLESFARASIATVIPLQAYALLKDEQQVSFLYTAVAVVGVLANFVVPVLIRYTARRWVYTFGALLLAVSALALDLLTLPGQAAGMLLRIFGAACLNVTISLYIMDFIAKADFVRNDAMRMALSTAGWTVGPTLGVWLYTEIGPTAAYGLTVFWTVIMLAAFWFFRLSDNNAIQPGKLVPVNPLRSIGRFVAQPRLRLAWLIAFGRSSFWQTVFIYGPILMVTTGEGSLAGGILVSLSNFLLIGTLLWNRVATDRGVRVATVSCFVGAAGSLIVCGFAAGIFEAGNPWLAAGLLLLGAAFAVGLDAVGGVAFFRAVKKRERAEMTAVYRTYLDASELIPPLIFGVLLGFFGLGAVFIAMGVFLLVCAALVWRHLPTGL